MPRYNPNAANANAVVEVFSADNYEFIIGEPKVSETNKDQEDGTVKNSVCVLYVLTHASGPYTGKKYFKRLYPMNKNAEDIAKQFMQAAHGFKVTADGEKAFNEAIATMDQSFDTDSSFVGDYWTKVKGSRVTGTLTTVMYQGEAQNKDGKWAPLST